MDDIEIIDIDLAKTTWSRVHSSMRTLHLKLSAEPVRTENAVALSWPSVSGRTYALQYSSLLSDRNAWQVLTNNIPGSGAVIECRDATTPTGTRFYRLGVAKD